MTSRRRLEIQVDQSGNAEKGLSKLSGGFSKLGVVAGPIGAIAAAGAAGIAILGGAAIAAGISLVGLGSDAEEMTSKFNVVFGDSAPMAITALDEFGNAVGRSKFELMEMASTVQDTFVPLGFARDEAADMSIELAKLAVDMGSFNNVADAEVMLALQSAIVGNHETMRKYGVIITQATLDQELLNMGVEGGVKEASEMEKVQARLNIIYAGTTDAHGDAATTADSWANKMRSLKSELSEAATTMGTELLPVVLPLLQNFTDWVKDIMPDAIEIFKEFASDLGETVGPALVLIDDAVKRIAEAFGVNTEEVSSADVVLGAFKATLDLVVIAIQGVATIMQGLARAVEAVRHAIGTLTIHWNDMKRAAQNAIDAIPEWLRPGSPTPFEMGLRGIGKAMGDINLGGMGMPAPAMAGGGMVGGSVTVNFSSFMSVSDQRELEEKLGPAVISIVRKARGVG